ncbi:hypothetical protein [Romboutsia sp.]|uniref:hypothetical protein n=1 Tax=Romboutsia sp. TaxID=1965302 RepID=UPI003F3C56CA
MSNINHISSKQLPFKKILIGSPIYQKKDILKEFLLSLEQLQKDNLIVDYYFIDDNVDLQSKQLLWNFKTEHDNVFLETSKTDDNEYYFDNYTHRWSDKLIEKVSMFKNNIINFSIEKDYDYLFLIDSDIVLHPKTLHQLISNEKEIISNIFWTQWTPDNPPLPQVWLKDDYKLYDAIQNENLTDTEIQKKTIDFINLLKEHGVYKVGGLGACTLISKSALLKGVNFNPLYNISFWGEDRHFCIRAAALGIDLFVDTYYPAFHIYRESDLLKVHEYKKNTFSNFSNEIVLRKQQWDETISTNSEWILFLDADEVLEDKFKSLVKDLIKNSQYDGYLFRLYDFWDNNHYREDELWHAHKFYKPFMIRYQENFNYKFNEVPHHCGRMPANVTDLSVTTCDLRIKHYGWADENDRLEKFNRYMEYDSDGQYGSMEQYLSILDPSPNIIEWIE